MKKNFRIIYFPLESYEERYTSQLSGCNGWMETAFNRLEVSFIRVDGRQTDTVISDLGVAGSPAGRGIWAMTQCIKFLEHLQAGDIRESDVLFFDEFWQPGIEAIQYALHLKGMSLQMYAYCWAQSVDEHDFTYDMLPWIRHFEQGIGQLLDGIFCACNCHKAHMIKGGVGTPTTVHVTGHCFNRAMVHNIIADEGVWEDRSRNYRVIYTGRWDTEKQPLVFLSLAELCRDMYPGEFDFRITTSSPRLRSNRPDLLQALQYSLDREQVVLLQGLTKQEYYRELCKAKILFNCANQDYISFGLLEGLTFGCTPLYPAYRSFLEVFKNHPRFLYPKGDTYAAALKIRELQENPITSEEQDDLLAPFEVSVDKMIQVIEAGRGLRDPVYYNELTDEL